MSSLDDASELSQANLAFLCSLYEALIRDNPNENVFFSPFSISLALSMTLAGAQENTQDQMKKTLCFDAFQESDLHQSFKALLNELMQKDGSVSIANGLFVQDKFQLLQPFIDTVQEMYNAISKNLDFRNNSEDAVSQVNNWVKDATRDKIPQLLEDVDPDTVLIIINAIYFKSLWMHKFDPSLTKLSDFYLNKNETVKVKMMHLREDLRHAKHETANCDILELPYEDGKTSLVVFLPHDVDGLAKLESMISSEFLKESLSMLCPLWPIELELPCFKLEEKYSLASTLKVMGMSDLFVPRLANLRGIATAEDLFVSEVIHKAVVEVNEEGTEAAAATSVGIVMMCLRYPKTFKADHPFMFCIIDNTSDTILFIGSLKKPKSA